MTDNAYEAAVLLARLVFAALLYLFLAAALWLAWRDLRQRAAGPTSGATCPPAEQDNQDSSAAPPAAQLVVLSAPTGDGGLGGSVPVQSGMLLGRRPPSDLVFQDEFLSSQHARIWHEAGSWWLEDLASTNGTFLNGRRVESPVRLAHDDEVAMGQIIWRFELGNG